MKKNQYAKVAVVTRTKDRPVLLERAIKSVHSQTMPDFIHVIINDAGDPQVVEKLLKKYDRLIAGRVKVIHNQVSKGMEAASNKAIKSVDSEYIAIHDDDDSWHPDFLKETTHHLEKTKAMGVVVTTDKVDEVINGDVIEQLAINRWQPDLRAISLYEQCLNNYATPITFLYRRAVFDRVGYYDETLPVAGDWDFALRFLLEYDIDYLITSHALAFYHHRQSAEGIDRNSVFVDGGLLHEQKITTIINKLLRQELRDGKTGLGHIIGYVRHAEAKSTELKKRMEVDVVRIESHVNGVVEQAAEKVVEKLYNKRLMVRGARKVKRILK